MTTIYLCGQPTIFTSINKAVFCLCLLLFVYVIVSRDIRQKQIEIEIESETKRGNGPRNRWLVFGVSSVRVGSGLSSSDGASFVLFWVVFFVLLSINIIVNAWIYLYLDLNLHRHYSECGSTYSALSYLAFFNIFTVFLRWTALNWKWNGTT